MDRKCSRGMEHLTPFRLIGRDDRMGGLDMFGFCLGFYGEGLEYSSVFAHSHILLDILLYVLASLRVFQTDLEPGRLVAN